MTAISFNASIPDIQAGIKIGSDGLRIQFDVPESDLTPAIKLADMRRKPLMITVRDDGKAEEESCPVRGKRKPGDTSKTPSQRLRTAIWKRYQAIGEKHQGEWDNFYNRFMEQFIKEVDNW